MPRFISTTVLKRDVFSETHKGYCEDAPDVAVIRRIVSAAPWWSKPVAWRLARQEIRGLEAVKGIPGTPTILKTDKDGLYRLWADGTPLHLARPQDAFWYKDARRLLHAMRRVGITHNDIAKPQNWLVLPDGSAGVIDFQLAKLHKRRGRLYRIMAYEDRRHLIKQKRSFAPHLLTPAERRILARRSLPSRIWLMTGKKLYNAVTRGIFNWSDGEGTGDRIDLEGPAIIAALKRHPAVTDVALAVYPFPRKGTGLYAFAEAPDGVNADDLAALQGSHVKKGGADLIQPVARLPRHADGTPRDDILRLIAMNQMTELDALVAGDPDMAAIAADIAAGRLNFTDRRLSKLEARAGA